MYNPFGPTTVTVEDDFEIMTNKTNMGLASCLIQWSTYHQQVYYEPATIITIARAARYMYLEDTNQTLAGFINPPLEQSFANI